MAKTKRKTRKGTAPSWRAIKQKRGKRAVTLTARLRKFKFFARFAGLGATALGAIAIGLLCFYFLKTATDFFHLSGPPKPLGSVVMHTNGVLDETWLKESFRPNKSTNLMDIDIRGLKKTLESSSQVRSAMIERQFPDVLIVNLSEYQPVAKVAVRGKKKARIYLVSKEGVVYEGNNYPRATLEHLPYLDGVELKQTKQGFRPIEGMEIISELLDLSRRRTPELYADWQVISLKNFSGDPARVGATILVRTRSIGEIIFSPQDLQEQLDRLDYIFQYIKDERIRKVKRIDLTLEDQAAVQLAIQTNVRRR